MRLQLLARNKVTLGEVLSISIILIGRVILFSNQTNESSPILIWGPLLNSQWRIVSANNYFFAGWGGGGNFDGALQSYPCLFIQV